MFEKRAEAVVPSFPEFPISRGPKAPPMIDYAACRGSRNAQKLGIGYNTIHNLRLPATAVFFERLPPSANILDRLGRGKNGRTCMAIE